MAFKQGSLFTEEGKVVVNDDYIHQRLEALIRQKVPNLLGLTEDEMRQCEEQRQFDLRWENICRIGLR